ncbi:MAG: phage portal protein [Candidatus Hermodarchaeota archaeon]
MSLKEVKKKIAAVKPTLIDRFVEWRDPVKGLERRKARVALALAGSYNGASRSRKSMQTWGTSGGDADADTLYDLPTLRERSRDLVRNNPLAAGAINVKVGNVVGTGLKLQSQIDYEFLGLTEEEADAFQRNAEREFAIWAESQDCDITRTQNFYGLQDLAFRSTLENADAFALLPYIERNNRVYSLAVQLIESDRVCNEGWKADSDRLAGGVEKDEYGAPVRYHILKQHPGAIRGIKGRGEWVKVDAFGGETGRRNVLHLYRKLRVGQTRGVPDLAPVIESLKQLGDYTEAELTAAVVSGLFTVFVHTEGDFSFAEIAEYRDKFGQSSDGEIKMGKGAMIDLGLNEKVDIANPGRPNQAFDPFVQAILRQIGTALEIPFELLIMQFNSSYSASKAAFETAWTFFRNRRKWLADNFCRPIYEAWMIEAVALGRIKAPGFMRDPAIRAAYLGSQWIGPAKMVLDMTKEANGRAIMEDRGWTTAATNTAELTGSDWETNQRQRAKEVRMQQEGSTAPQPKAVTEPTAKPAPEETEPDEGDADKRNPA